MPKYRQPHNIPEDLNLNPALAAKLVEKNHREEKYYAKYTRDYVSENSKELNHILVRNCRRENPE